MTREERNNKLKYFITCMKCEVSGKCCDENCPIQYDAGNMGEIIENLEEISKILEQECEDAVSRQAVLDIVKFEENWLSDAKSNNANADIAFSGIRTQVAKLSPVIPARKKGKWIYSGSYDEVGTLYCSNCKHEIDVSEGYFKWCPNCGAKMEK